MPVFGVDFTVCDTSLTDAQRDATTDLTALAREVYGADVIAEHWENEGVGYLRIVTSVSAPTLVDALENLTAKSRRARERIGLKPNQQVGVSIAVRDLSHPIDLALPPVRLPRWRRV